MAGLGITRRSHRMGHWESLSNETRVWDKYEFSIHIQIGDNQSIKCMSHYCMSWLHGRLITCCPNQPNLFPNVETCYLLISDNSIWIITHSVSCCWGPINDSAIHSVTGPVCRQWSTRTDCSVIIMWHCSMDYNEQFNYIVKQLNYHITNKYLRIGARSTKHSVACHHSTIVSIIHKSPKDWSKWRISVPCLVMMHLLYVNRN